MRTIKRKLERFANRKVLFIDLFDTLVHRTVHPNYAFRLWAKFMARELGIQIPTEELFAIRAESLFFVSAKQKRPSLEVRYEDVVKEVYIRLSNTDNLSNVTYNRFQEVFERADYVAETSVQFKNKELISILKDFKENGNLIYILSDFYLSKKVVSQILDFHEILDLFDDIFISCSVGESKEKGGLYPFVLNLTHSKASATLMIGDNKKSDVQNAEKYHIAAHHLKHLSHKIRNKRNLFGSDENDFKKICQNVEKRCTNSEHAFSKYILHFYFFTERLYLNAKRNNVKNLFFLAREGSYLKRLFDCYQEMNLFKSESKIQTHYLKASRQSATQVALKRLIEEDFEQFRGRFGKMNLEYFLNWFPFSDRTKSQIINELPNTGDENSLDFFKSETMGFLRNNITFQEAYEKNRKNQKIAFNDYLHSFGTNIEEEGINLVDVGWGGTMQEGIYKFLGGEIPVTGYYLGLKEVYNIGKGTKRYGLNFSVYPSPNFSYDILKANGQLYEQLLAAPHGSTLSYRVGDTESPTLEFHEENEKNIFDNFVEPIQEYMFLEFIELFDQLRPIDYSQTMAQEYLTDMALRTGILTSKKKIKFINQLSKGFYQNVGENKVGLTYDPKQLKISKLKLFKEFIKSPEKVFKYLVKVKPFLYAKGLYWISWPINLTYYYIKFNFWFKKKWLNKGLVS